VEKFCILLWQARVGREIERYKREMEEETMTEQQGEMTRALYTTGGLGRCYKQTDAPPWVNISLSC
jgi:hypothetical protein